MSSAKRSHLASWLAGKGIELGALHQPLPVPAGVRVEYVDRYSADDLRRQYPELATLDLVPVTHIGSAEQLTAIPGGSLDFVIACHVLEHLEDPTGGLREIYRVLRDGGIFFCALPEPRVTFDSERLLTTVEHLVTEHGAGLASRRDHFIDWVDNVERHQPWWRSENPDPIERVDMLMEMDYSIHYHVWRPDTFLEYLSAVRHEYDVVFEMVDFAACQPPADDEFIFILRKGIAPVPLTAPDRAHYQAIAARGQRPLTHPLGARQALREAALAARVAASSLHGAGMRRIGRTGRR